MTDLSRLDQPVLLPTDDTGVVIPCNTKYLSGNRLSRRLIRGFMHTLVDLARQTWPASVLDVGCGEGLLLRQLMTLWGQTEVHGLDIAPELLDAARQVEPKARYVRGSVYQLPISDGAYDLVLCAEVLEHLEAPSEALAELARSSRGFCLLSVPHEPWWRVANMARGSYWPDLGNTPGHLNHWTSPSFVKLVERYLDVVEIRHPFPWIMLLAKVRGSQ